MAPSTPGSLRATFSDGVATAKQLVAAGVPERTVYHRCLDGGPWQLILPGGIFLFTGRPTRRQLVLAAVLLGGPDAMVTGLEACRRYGLRRGPARIRDERESPEEVDLLVPQHRQLRSVGYVHVTRTKSLPEPVLREGVPLAPLTRACTDAARRRRNDGEIAELISDAVQRNLCTVAALGRQLDDGSRRGTAIPRRVLRSVADGARSAAELDAQKLWRGTGLPEPLWNVEVRTAGGVLLGIADCWVDDVAMVWEIESTEWHLSPEDHDRTVERAGEFVAAGAVYTASKPRKIRTDRAGVIRMLRQTYAQAAARPRPALYATPRDAHPLQ
ncbi:hypothetical protein [Pseudonocardia nigra]|uniref:hypothetical protein n=1 Tax=Pseudonocardia nigra TaxID=1921578 RepID=UPI001C5EABF5|nr:hypothetical protein [Pseudonocardia nigra]